MKRKKDYFVVCSGSIDLNTFVKDEIYNLWIYVESICDKSSNYSYVYGYTLTPEEYRDNQINSILYGE